MRIVVNEQLKDEIEWTCKYANEYKVDIDIHIDADGEISVSVCPTYRDTADTPQTEETCERCVYVRGSQWCQGCNGIPKRWDGEKIADTPQTDTHEKAVEALAYLIGQKKPSYSSGSNSYGEQVQTDKTDCDKCIWSVCNYNKVDWEADTPQTETQNSNKNANVISVYDGVSEAVRCAMCSNPNKSDRGCDGACSYDEKLYERIMKAIAESVADTPQTDVYDYKGNGKWERSE